jgi:hypothetical protein
MYTQSEIQPYLDDYANVTGTVMDKLVDPMTLQACELRDLIRGHIINEKIPYAYNTKVPVLGKPDHWYGSRVENSFIHFCTLSGMSGIDMLRGRTTFNVKFREGGPTLEAFVVDDEEVAEKSKHITIVPISRDGQRVYIGLKKAKPKDPEVPTGDRAEITWEDRYLPAHWVASMLKVGHLTAFHIFGYRAILDPCGDVLRRVLVSYFYDNASGDDAPSYFRQFENSVKVIGLGTTFDAATYAPADIDTLRDRKFLSHMNAKRLFALTLVYKLSDKTISVTLPQTMDKVDIAGPTRWYDMLMAEDPGLKQTVHVTHFDGKSWHVGPEIGAHYQPPFDSLEVGERH